MGVWRYPPGDEATTERWYVQPGQRVAKGDALVSLSTEAATALVAAPADGVIAEILAGAHATVRPGDPLIRIDGGDQDATPAPSASPAKAPEKTTMATSNDNVTPILMPQVGNSMEEGTILSWKVAEGDRIEQGQIIYEVEDRQGRRRDRGRPRGSSREDRRRRRRRRADQGAGGVPRGERRGRRGGAGGGWRGAEEP